MAYGGKWQSSKGPKGRWIQMGVGGLSDSDMNCDRSWSIR